MEYGKLNTEEMRNEVDYFEKAQISWLKEMKDLKSYLLTGRTKEALQKIDMLIYEIEGDLKYERYI